MWAIYALGGGWGHLTRAVALARAVRARAAVRIITNCQYAEFVQRHVPGLDVRVVSSCEETLLCLAGCDCLIVDTFPRGLLGELADWLPGQSMRKVLVARDLNPEYVSSFALRAFVAEHYDLILLPGEGEAFADLPQARMTNPWLAADVPAPEFGPRAALVCATGNHDEHVWYGEVAASLSSAMPVICLSAARPPGCPQELWQVHWPALELFGRVAVVVGGAGYNLVNETRAAGVPLIARAWPRLYDRQALRAQRAGATLVTTAAEAVEAACNAGLRNRVVFENGAKQAADAILYELTSAF
jgi:hypothetical protein